MSRPILLWSPHKSIASDDACTNIVKYTLPPAPTHGIYSHQSRPQLSYVPSLMYFCIQKLIDYPDHFHVLGPARIQYRRDPSPQVFDILRALIPSYDHSDTLDLSVVDPRLWALLVQVYTGLPDAFRTYTIPLSDTHLPLLQQIPMTPDFALLTVVALPGCKDLRDDTILEFKALHGLCALDASETELSAWGIRNLSKTLAIEDADESGSRRMKGPWELRILRLRNCVNVKDDIFEYLMLFPLLSVVELRGTQCMRHIHPGLFRPNNCASLFHPTPLLDVLDYISDLAAHDSIQIYSHPAPFILFVNTLHHKHPSTRNSVRLFPSRPRNHHDHASAVQTHLQSAVPTNEQELAAMEEVRLHNSRRGAEAFYAVPLPPVRPVSAAPAHSRDIRRTLPSFGEVEFSFLPPHRDALTLFRKPPPWSTLEAIQRDKPERVHVQKRRRTDGDIAEVARKEGKGEVKAVWDMISRRMSEMGGKRGGHITNGEVRTRSVSDSFPSKNPFLREKSGRSTLAHVSSGNIPAEGSAVESSTIVQAESVTHHLSSMHSNMAVPPKVNKPLLPISSLKVPVLPPSLLKQNIPPNTKIRAPKSIDGGKQIVLPAVKRSKSAVEMRKESSSKFRHTDVRRLSNGSVGGSGKDTIKAKGRSEGKDTGFDWDRWGGG